MPDLKRPLRFLHERLARMAMTLQVSLGSALDSAPNERAVASCLPRHTTHSDSILNVPEQKTVTHRDSEDDQFSMMFCMMMNCVSVPPRAEHPQRTQASQSVSAPTGHPDVIRADGTPVLLPGDTTASSHRTETDVTFVNEAAAFDSQRQSQPTTGLLQNSTATPVSTNSEELPLQVSAGMSAQISATRQNQPQLNGGSDSETLEQDIWHNTAGLTAEVRSDPGTMSVLRATVVPDSATANEFETGSVQADLTVNELMKTSEQADAPEVHRLTRKLKTTDDLDGALQVRTDQPPTELVSLAQTSGTLAAQELSTAICGEMRQPLTHQVSQAVIDQLERTEVHNAESLTVRLDPPELGEIVIELSKTRDGLAVRVTARETVTMDMLLARGSEIESQLRDRQLDLKTLEFLSPDMNGGRDSERQQSHSAKQSGNTQSARRTARPRIAESGMVSHGRLVNAESRQALSFRA